MIDPKLLAKYDVQVPRYTSYPTVPYWTDNPTTEEWISSVQSAFAAGKQVPWSIYIHLPFCETLCTFCGCNNSITKDHSREESYVELLNKEWAAYLKNVPAFGEHPLRQIHLGGGTPTFFSVANLKRILQPILEVTQIDPSKFEGAIEVDPRRTTVEQLEALRDMGFNRISLGVQDFDPEVQRLINRIQPFEMTEKITLEARRLGYTSVNFDLIYGLPKQTKQSIQHSVELTLRLKPDRIALYSLAKVPWIKPAQRLFKDEDLPEGADKRELYELAREGLTQAGYVEIGMDHFALPNDGLAIANNEGSMHRNFMGYTEMRTDVLIGMGVSAISESPTCFHQNEKALPVYERRVGAGEIPTLRGHKLDHEDMLQREKILTLMTKWQVELPEDAELTDARLFLASMIEDELVQFEGHTLKITDKGRPFLRNACAALDKRMRAKAPDTRIFSKSL